MKMPAACWELGGSGPVGGLGRMRLHDFFSEKCTEAPSSQSGSFLTTVVDISLPLLFIGGNCQVGKKKKRNKAEIPHARAAFAHGARAGHWLPVPSEATRLEGQKADVSVSSLPQTCSHNFHYTLTRIRWFSPRDCPEKGPTRSSLYARGLKVPKAQGTAEPHSHSILLGCIPHGRGVQPAAPIPKHLLRAP